tara:strand:+ start:320 stop:688 length:369 start_codon:yes stop_codon:yes gene_type:complete
MDMKILTEQLEEDDFVIRVRPFADDEGKWSGEVDISIMSFPENEMDDKDYSNVMHFCKMMCAAVPIMEEAKEFRDIIHEYVINVVDNDMEINVELEEECGVEKTYEDNIVHLNFNSKTGGSA